MITGFVLIMMLIIEYLNVLTRGNWDRVIARWTWGQNVLCSFLGATPGCLGAYAAASLYMHRVVTIGALTAAMVASCGDEAFMMLALFPKKALAIFGVLFVAGVVVGTAVDLATRSRRAGRVPHGEAYNPSHTGVAECVPFSRLQVTQQWRHCSPHRGWLTVILALFLLGVISGAISHVHIGDTHHESAAATVDARETGEVHHDRHEHSGNEGNWNWVRVTLLVQGLIAILIVATVPDHFLDEHLWEHLVKVHAWRVLAWTLGALVITQLLVRGLDVGKLIEAHRFPVLMTACLVGLLPASGPHLVFVTLFAEGALPLSSLMANCIVQEGHGLIPTLAHSRKAFVAIKALKFVIGLAVGLLGAAMGW